MNVSDCSSINVTVLASVDKNATTLNFPFLSFRPKLHMETMFVVAFQGFGTEVAELRFHFSEIVMSVG